MTGTRIADLSKLTGATQELTIGRDPACDLIIADDTVSGRHAALRVSSQSMELVDLKSTNGTWVAGERLQPGIGIVVEPGAQLHLGAVPVLVQRSDSAGATLTRLDTAEVTKIPTELRRFALIQTTQSSPRDGNLMHTVVASAAMQFGPIGWAVAGATLLHALATRGGKQVSREGRDGWIVLAPEAAKAFRFADANPVEGRAFGLHPLRSDTYIELSVFHETLLAEKMTEFLELCACLGAKRVRLEHQVDADASTKGQVQAPVHAVPIQVGAGYSTAAMNKRVQEEFFANNNVAPFVPEGLCWFERESDWRALADRRLKHRVERSSLRIDHREDFGVNADVSAGVAALKLKATTHVSRFDRSSWLAEVEFYPVP